MKKQITLAIVTLALIVGGILTRVWAIDWPQSAFRQAQTAFNPVETILAQLPGSTGTGTQRIVFVTHGMGVQNAPLKTDDPAYVQGIAVTATDSDFTATPLGKLKIQEPLPSGSPRETRVTGLTFADIGDS